VDSEHKKNSQSDAWRILQLAKGTSLPGHPWNKFGTGDRNSLSAYGRAVAARRIQEAKKQNGQPNPNIVANGVVNGLANGDAISADSFTIDPANPLPALESENDPDGGPVGRETRKRLMEWWEKEYCAGRMKLAIVGRGVWFLYYL
jgi:insulysin